MPATARLAPWAPSESPGATRLRRARELGRDPSARICRACGQLKPAAEFLRSGAGVCTGHNRVASPRCSACREGRKFVGRRTAPPEAFRDYWGPRLASVVALLPPEPIDHNALLRACRQVMRRAYLAIDLAAYGEGRAWWSGHGQTFWLTAEAMRAAEPAAVAAEQEER